MSIQVQYTWEGLKNRILKEPDQAIRYLEMGWHLHQLVSYEEAIRAYQAGLSLRPDSDTLHCKLGLTYHNEGDHKLAIQHYLKAVGINSNNFEAQYYMGFILIQEGKVKEAITYLEKSIAIHPDLTNAYYYLGIALERSGQHDKARRTIENRLVSSYPAIEPEVAFTFGEIVSGRRRYITKKCHTEAITEALLETINKTAIHCFGDSHRSIFNNLSRVSCYNVGAGTAYNLNNKSSSTGAGNKIHRALENLNQSRDAILLVFGEIDCMEHLFKNSYRKNTNPENSAINLATRYLNFAQDITRRGFTVMIYGPSFSGHALNSHGLLEERNMILKVFNKKVKEGSERDERIMFATLDELMVNSKMAPRIELSDDGRHLDYFPSGSKVLQGIILHNFLSSAKKKFTKENEQTSHPCSPEPPKIKTYHHSKPFAIINKRLVNSCQNQKNDCTDKGTLNINHQLKFPAEGSIESGILVDLLDHLLIQSISFEWSLDCSDLPPKVDINVLGIHQEGEEQLAKHNLNQKHPKCITIEFEPIIIRGLCIRFCWNTKSPNEGTQTNNTYDIGLIITNLCISGPTLST